MKFHLPTGLLLLASSAKALSGLRGTKHGRRTSNLVCPEGWALLNNYDLITAKDVNTNSDVEGKTFIGGDLTNSNSATFGAHLDSTTETTFSIAGNIESGNAINIIKGSMSHHPNLQSSETNDGDWIVNGREFEIQDPDTSNHAYGDPNIVSTAASYASQLEELSDFLADLEQTTDNEIQIPGSQPSAFKFIVNDVDEYGVAVFHIQDTKLFENVNVQQIEVVTNVIPDLVVINVEGTGVGWWNNVGGLVGSWLTQTDGRSKTIWNFYEATWVSFGSKGMGGTVLAPRAKLTIMNPVDGTVAVRKLMATSEVHFPLLSVECPYLTNEASEAPSATPTPSCACPDGWELISTYNLITAKDVNTNSDVEGKTFIGGDLTNSNSATFGAHLDSTTETTFSIAGNIESGNAINIIKGSMSHHPNLQSSETNDGDWIVNGREFEIQDPDTSNHAYGDPNIASTATSYTSQLEELSDFLANLEQTTDNEIQIPGSQPSAFTFIVNHVEDNGVAVFHIQDTKLFENVNVQQIEVVTNVIPDLIIINVEGTGVGWWNNVGGLVGSWLTQTNGRSKTIWNFYEATWVSFGSKGMGGTVLAPRAKLTIKNPVDGAVAVKELMATSEVHFPLLSVDCPCF